MSGTRPEEPTNDMNKRRHETSDIQEESHSPSNKLPRKSGSSELLAEMIQKIDQLCQVIQTSDEHAATRHQELLAAITRNVEIPRINIPSENPPPPTENVRRLIDLQSYAWKNAQFRRNKAFTSYYKNSEKAEIYERYLVMDPPFIPLKCREKLVKGQEDLEWEDLQRDKETNNTEHEVKKLKRFASVSEQKIKEIDGEITDLFKHLPDPTKIAISEIWKSETSTCEAKIKQGMERNREFLQSLPTRTTQNEKKPSHHQSRSSKDNQGPQLPYDYRSRRTTPPEERRNAIPSPRNEPPVRSPRGRTSNNWPQHPAATERGPYQPRVPSPRGQVGGSRSLHGTPDWNSNTNFRNPNKPYSAFFTKNRRKGQLK